MRPLVLDRFGTRLSVSHFRLVVDEGTQKEEYEARRFSFDAVFFLTHAYSITGEALRFLYVHNIPAFVLDWHGQLQTSILPAMTLKGRLRVEQWEAWANPTSRQKIASRIIAAKVAKQEKTLAEIGRPLILDKTDEAHSALSYWSRMGQQFEELGYPFGRRQSIQHPHFAWRATSIPNSLINYSYGYLLAKVRTEVNLASLDDSLGFIHTPPKGKSVSATYTKQSGLSFDLMEPFRPDADLAVVCLLKSKPRITERDFSRNADDYSLRLRRETARRLLEVLESNLNAQEIRGYVRGFAKSLQGRPR